MNVYVPKNKVTSRCSGQRRDVLESFICNVATLGSTLRRSREVFFSTPRRWNSTLRCSREVFFQHSDVGTQRPDVPQSYYFNIAALEPNIAMFPRGILSMSRRS